MSELIVNGLGSTPGEVLGSTTGATCPQFFGLEDGTTGVIGERLTTPEQAPDEAVLHVEAAVLYDTAVHVLGRSSLAS